MTQTPDGTIQRFACEGDELGGAGAPDVFRFGAGEVRISVEDEGGKIDLNTASEELLRGLFLSTGLDDRAVGELFDAIAEFVDEDQLHRLNGAEDPDYYRAGLAWGAKDAPFEAVEELQQVMGMTRDLYARVAPLLTVHSGRTGIDPRTASRAALLALPGVSIIEVDTLLAARASTASTARAAGAAGDDGDDGEVAPLPELTGVADHLTRSRQRVYTIRAEARTDTGAVFVREAAVEPLGSLQRPFIVYKWRRGRRLPPLD